MKSKDILKLEFEEDLQKAMQNTKPGAMAEPFINLMESIGTFNQKEEMIMQQSTKINSIKENGIKAATMSKSDFIKEFGGNSKDISFNDFAQQVLLKNGEIKQEVSKRTDGSVMAPIGISADIIYNACQKSVLLNNCPIVPMKTGTVRIGKVDEDMELDFKERGAVGKNTSLGLTPIDLNAKTLYGYVEVAEEDIQDVYKIENILMNAFADAVAKALDDNFLYTNTKESIKEGVYPKGILDNENIKKVTVKSTDYDMIAKARLAIVNENGEPDTVALNPNELYAIQILKDSNGQYINEPKFYSNLNKIESTRVKTKNGLVMDSNSIVIGMRDELNIKIMDNIKNGTVLMRVMVRADVLPVRENHICKIEVVAS
ncbi:phage major capsid protein, HK97 family [Clostridium botulinum 202F]|uniref:phage major capsid protein n=2 Tax=unclassified Clostridium TaxID=2614128 RepID=UPI000540E5E9|nr:phage major capsid protein [Clostridium sp. ZBS4]AIY81309.1 phage major capsid protein, HK97 family [Clostridium botulinum 202F]KAI3344825.1 phage major capsid protein [Clostridium botulinum]KON11689.1 hypothetical protein ACP50_16910 [Clostridium botulinum]MBY6988289.1 phage major capsid protein [Clostridium botulinum]NFH00590.1 phage major capsid protein [Clostridium botulinum]